MTAAAALAPGERDNAFLGVARSVCGRAWRSRLDRRGEARALTMTQRHQVPELLARILAGRGVEPDEVAAFLNPSIRDLLPEPHVLTAMEAAAGRIADAIQSGEQIAIFGDYDVDGATSAALLGRYLRHCGREAFIHIPDRLFEGYGPNAEAIRTLAERGAKLLVTVDCGTTSIEALQEATKLGLQTVIIDHHQCGETLPDVFALVNPNRNDDLSQLGHLAAVGLVFVTLVAVNRILRTRGFFSDARPAPELLDYLDLVALGTIADVVPLKGLNRAFVAKGLIAMRRREGVGLTALMNAAKLDGPPEPWHLGFLLGPRINAGGRIGRADLGARLLMETDDIEAARIATELNRLNIERREMEVNAVAQAEAEAEAAMGKSGDVAAIVTASREWHPGIVGLIAARLKEKFNRPAFAIALDVNGQGTGSGRSIQGVDLGKAVREGVARDLLVKGGGHAMAAGVTIAPGRLSEFRAYLDEALAASVANARRDSALKIDGALSAAAAKPEMINTLMQAGPFGSGNPEPIVAFPAHTIAFAETLQDKHVRARLRSGDGSLLNVIAFRTVGEPLGNTLLERRGQPVHAAGTLSIDRWQGGERVQLRLMDLAIPT